jgi:hypothetical protein
MAKLKTSKYIITDVKADKLFPGERSGWGKVTAGKRIMPTHVMWLDGEVIPGAFYSECVWVWPECASEEPAAEAHTHDFTEVITFFGTNFSDPHDLGGEVELWLDGEKHVMTRSFLAYIPAGMTHCPLIFRKVQKPIFHFTVGLGTEYVRGKEK